MATKKVRIEMEETWAWWIPGVNGYDGRPGVVGETIDVEEQWLEELKQVSKRYSEMRSVLEHLYRKQEGLRPFTLDEDEKEEMRKASPEYKEEQDCGKEDKGNT
jgi:hypothetical protein